VHEIDRVLARLAAAPGCLLARMTGSGGTCFGLFAVEAAAVDAAGAIAHENRSWWVQATYLVHEGETADVVSAHGKS
ncbi:MAG: 4-(cytidine 5'-diphospho)-2-C-methyl-D-erythritol kinase, partial [Alphaproteobacteria bacterium]|nr:4-(cytidine 5'-diphospho)-2-C-methyl-D-erythritol kinase [Alphaproteobacteria bacterium]